MKIENKVPNERSFKYNKRLFHELSTASDFGIPERFTIGLKKKINEHKKLRIYLSFLLNRLRSDKFIQRLPVFIGTKTVYQDPDQNLEYFKFRPYVKDWTELMLIARAHGGSATAIFVALLEFDLLESDIADQNSFEGVWLPEKPIKFLQTLNLRKGLWVRFMKYGRSSYQFHEGRFQRGRPE